MQNVPQNGHPPQPVSAYDWETDTYTYNVQAMDPAQLWRSAVALAATKARQALPECSTRIDRATELVLNNAVELLDGGQAKVHSQNDQGVTSYHISNGSCDCADFPRAPLSWCKHKLARALTVKAMQIAKQLGQAESTMSVTPAALPDDLDNTAIVTATGAPRIPPALLYERQGTTAILFGGLLHMAHEAGLLSLTVDVVTVTVDLAVMRATARFRDGGQWTDIGDATPQNVGTRIAPHFIRMASTRAMARCLRTALDIPYVCSVELADE